MVVGREDGAVGRRDHEDAMRWGDGGGAARLRRGGPMDSVGKVDAGVRGPARATRRELGHWGGLWTHEREPWRGCSFRWRSKGADQGRHGVRGLQERSSGGLPMTALD
ncbi:hypothetical protein ZWY2020_040862 [Hordeum vulgare]|nr:hypothetical protein ZWY2020_040862 [Hordeum vulgare]